MEKASFDTEKTLTVITGKEECSIQRLPSVKNVRPYLVCCVLQNLDISGENFKKFITIQTKLHSSLCGNRTIAAIGTHDLKSFAPPLKYLALPPHELRITALHKKSPVSAKELIDALLLEADLARRRAKRNTLNPLHRQNYIRHSLEIRHSVSSEKARKTQELHQLEQENFYLRQQLNQARGY